MKFFYHPVDHPDPALRTLGRKLAEELAMMEHASPKALCMSIAARQEAVALSTIIHNGTVIVNAAGGILLRIRAAE